MKKTFKKFKKVLDKPDNFCYTIIRKRKETSQTRKELKMLYRYGYYVDSVFADSFVAACEYFAAHHEYFDEDEVWLDGE